MTAIEQGAEFHRGPASGPAPAHGRRARVAMLALAGVLALAAVANQAARHFATPPAGALFLEGLNPAQIDALVRDGHSVALVPSGDAASGDATRVARMLGNALIAPAADLGAGEQAYAVELENTARALQARGFRAIAFLGDSTTGTDARIRETVAARLNREWQPRRVRVVSLTACCAVQNGTPAEQARIDAAVTRIRRALGRIDA